MRWKGETYDEWYDRVTTWQRSFCWKPRQTDDGMWVWLDFVWERLFPIDGDEVRWVALADLPNLEPDPIYRSENARIMKAH
ncbi:hypothetical protein [Manganibacter manganicus]|uniref:Uncharacterized protein n=1 Tax=Manganibacter manganicus TaxID=1873176 RepID=A0A1V8RNZ1_9HYPH|nr:hypothetical protein [Pseudaminobacter manganicus]OQM74910.1 hypothetical protein BFN67_04660 [Pseudaminobacter manganicus]